MTDGRARAELVAKVDKETKKANHALYVFLIVTSLVLVAVVALCVDILNQIHNGQKTNLDNITYQFAHLHHFSCQVIALNHSFECTAS